MLCFLIYFFTICVKLLWNTDVFLQSLALTLNKSFQKSSHTYYQTKLVVNSNTCSFLPDKNYYLYRITRSILICITFALFSFQVPFFCSWEQISATTLIVAQVYFQYFWWAQMDSNHRPHAYQACALTTWAMRPFLVEMRRIELLTLCVQGRCSPSWATPPCILSFKLLPATSKSNNAKVTTLADQSFNHLVVCTP